MEEFIKKYKKYEELNFVEKMKILRERINNIIIEFEKMNLDLNVFISFITGITVKNDNLNQKDYLFIYPYLLKTFGHPKNLYKIKKNLEKNPQIKLEDDIAKMQKIYQSVDQNIKDSIVIVTICLISCNKNDKVYKQNYLKRILIEP